MKPALRISVLILLGGCSSPNPEFLRHAELRRHIAVPWASPMDPASMLFTLHADGRVTWIGHSLTPEEMLARTSAPSSDLNTVPVLLDVDPEAGFQVVRDALQILIEKAKCINISFLVSGPGGLGALVLPVLRDVGLGYRVREGRAEEQVLDGWGPRKYLELVIAPGNEGAMDVEAVNYGVPGAEMAVYFPPAGEKPAPPSKPPNFSWVGEHPPAGRWTPELLKDFLSRRDVAALSPYILLKITARERASDVIRCLSVLRSSGAGIIVPDIPARP